VSFHLAGSAEDNVWVAEKDEHKRRDGCEERNSEPTTLHIDLTANPCKVSSVHSLMNCFYGEAQSHIGSITFSFADDSKHTVDIVVGKNVRDYYQALRFCSSISDSSTVTEVMAPSAPTWIRLDMQSWILPLSSTPSLCLESPCSLPALASRWDSFYLRHLRPLDRKKSEGCKRVCMI